ncbi:MAG: hypothetical protein ABIT83_18335 [Massilia sp.]
MHLKLIERASALPAPLSTVSLARGQAAPTRFALRKLRDPRRPAQPSRAGRVFPLWARCLSGVFEIVFIKRARPHPSIHP